MKSASPKKAAASTPKGDKRSIQIEAIVEAALLEIDEGGLEAFRIRNLAARLNIYPAAIYWYLPNKDLILSEVVKRVLSGVGPVRADGFWRDRLRELFLGFREAVREHPNVAPLLGGTLIPNATMDLHFVETVLGIVQDAGLKGQMLRVGYNTVIAALVGFVSEEFAELPHEGITLLEKQVTQRLVQVDAEEFPVLSANIDLLVNQAFILRWENGATAPMLQTYSYYIDVVTHGLSGLAAMQSNNADLKGSEAP